MSRIAHTVLAGLLSAGALALTAPAQAQDNQVVVKDQASGKLRAATPEEAAALRAQEPAQRAAARAGVLPTLQKHHHSGARGARLSDEFMSHSVVVRNADGGLEEACYGSAEEADRAVKSAAKAPSAKPAPKVEME